MVALIDVTASNKRIASTFPRGLVAVFVGGTSGVGEYTLKALAKHSPTPRIYLVGRSQEAADRILQECRHINPEGQYKFLKADVGLLKNVDNVCRQIKAQESFINVLVLSTGTMAFSAVTAEGLPLDISLAHHSRLRFILNLTPLLQKSDSLRRVVSVGAGTLEGPIDLNNMTSEGFPLMQRRDQNASIHTLLLEEAARRAPDVTFIHDVPGVVKGGISREAEGLKMNILIAVTNMLGPLIRTPPEECAERHVFYATSAMYPPRDNSFAGVSLKGELAVTSGSDGSIGSGMYTADNKNESAPPRVKELLGNFRKDGTAKKVWDYVATDLRRITRSEAAA